MRYRSGPEDENRNSSRYAIYIKAWNPLDDGGLMC